MSHTHASLVSDLRSAGVRAGDALVVHASMRSIGPIVGGADTLIDAIVDAVGPGGTLLIPAFSAPSPEGVFDIRHTPSRLGALSERFRGRASRSLHPTHSVCAMGRHVEWLDGHETRSGLGVGSPLHRAAEAGARVLMIGCGMTACSTIHIAEASERVPYLGKVWFGGYDRALRIVRADGSTADWSPVDPPTCSDGFDVIESAMDAEGLIQRVRMGDAPSLIFSGHACMEVARRLLRCDAASLLCDASDCPVCPAARRIVSATHSPGR